MFLCIILESRNTIQKNRNADGRYMLDEWTCTSEVGNVFNGAEFKREEYFAIEAKYVAAVLEFLRSESISRLRVIDLETRFTKDYLLEKENEWLVSDTFHEIELNEDQSLNFLQLKTVIQMNLRGFLSCRLEINETFGLRFGWDYYMYICCLNPNNDSVEIINKTGLFVEKSELTYNMRQCDFYLQTCSLDEDGHSLVEEEVLLKDMTREKIRQGLGLSQEHTGNHSFQITKENCSIFKGQVEFDFAKHEYYSYCDKIYI